MPRISALLELASELPADAQTRIEKKLGELIDEEARQLEERIRAIRHKATGKTKAPARTKKRAAAPKRRANGRKKKRMSEADYTEVRSALLAALDKKTEYPQAALFKKAQSLGFGVKKNNFTAKVLDPLCNDGSLKWNEQRRGSAYQRIG